MIHDVITQERLDEIKRSLEVVTYRTVPIGTGFLITLIAHVEAQAAELAAARSVTRRLYDGWDYDPSTDLWLMYGGAVSTDMTEPVSSAERAWLQTCTEDPT